MYTTPLQMAATGSGEDNYFDECDIAKLYDALYPLRRKYKLFALQINVMKSEIENIEAQYKDLGECLLEILNASIKQGLTLDCVDKALRSQSVWEHKIAENVFKIFGNRDISSALEVTTHCEEPRKRRFANTPPLALSQEKEQYGETKRPKLYPKEERESCEGICNDAITVSSEGKKIEGPQGSTDTEEYKFDSKESSSSSSETEDCLTELDASEKKNLVKVFKCSFGKLCCTITNPVETAVHMQEKGLLSCKIMENLITSPESKQVKTITLVNVLKKVVKLHPNKIFVIIDVLLHDEILKETGREIWIEAGM